MTEWATEILIRGGTRQQVMRALAVRFPGIRTLHRRQNSQAGITIPAQLLRALGWTQDMPVFLEINERGNLEIREVTDEELPGFSEILATSGYLKPAPPCSPGLFYGCYKRCKDCGRPIFLAQKAQKWCSECGPRRRRESKRCSWQRNKENWPSYLAQRKQSKPRRADLEPVPA